MFTFRFYHLKQQTNLINRRPVLSKTQSRMRFVHVHTFNECTDTLKATGAQILYALYSNAYYPSVHYW